MKIAAFLELHEKLCYVARNLTIAKGNDYSGGDDTLANLKMVEVLSKGRVSAEIGVLVRMTDKLSRMWELSFHESQVKDESIADTELDMINYTCLKRAVREDNKEV